MQTRDYWPVRPTDAESNDDDSIRLEEGSQSIRFDDITPEVGRPTTEEIGPANSNATLPGHAGQALDGFIALEPPARDLPVGPIGPVSQTQTMVVRANEFEDPHPPEQSVRDFIKFFWIEGNWTDLLATSLNWMLLDFTFYLLGVNSARIIPSMFSTPKAQPPFPYLVSNEWHTLVATSIGAVLGGAVAIKIMNNFSRRIIQMWSFLILSMLFVVVGALYVKLLNTTAAVWIVAVYVLCQFFFNAGEFESSKCICNVS